MTLQIGKYKASALQTGSFGLDGGAMFGVVPKPLWEKKNPSDAFNRIDLRTRCLLLQGQGKNILIDCGMGNKADEKFRNRFKVAPYELETELAKHSLSTNQITDYVATHLHFDHAGGLTKLDNEQKITAQFPNANIWVQKKNWEHAWNPNEKDRASYLQENFAIFDNDSRLQLIDGPEEIFPGIRMILSEGHTFGMQLPLIESNDKSLLYCADIIPTSSHVSIPWVMGYDCQPLVSMQEKRKLLEAAIEKNWLIFFEHCPYMDAASVEFNGKDYLVKEKVQI